MEALLGFLLVTYVLTRAVSTAKLDHTYAKQGQVSPRLKAKYGDGAQAKVAKYGFFDFAKDAWNDYWPRRTDALIAARNAKATNPGERVSWRDRWAAATNVITTVGRNLADSVSARADAQPAPVEVVPLEPAPALAVDTGDVPVGTVKVTDAGREQWDGADWWPIPEQPKAEVVPAPVVERVATPGREAPMSAPTGEAVNYETTVAEFEALSNEQRGHVDQCQAALKSLNDAKGAINNMQESYRSSAAAAASISEHLAAKSLDGVTLANAGTVADAMPAGVVDAMYDRLEEMEAEASARLADAEIALASTEVNLTHVRATYGDAHATVAGNLSGDSSFLDSGGGASVGGSGGGVGFAGPGGGGSGDGTARARRGGDGAPGGSQPSGEEDAPDAGSGSSGSRSTPRVGIHVGEGDNVTFTGVIGGPSSGVKVPKGPKGPGSNSVVSHGGTINFKGIVGDGSTYNAGD